MAKRKFYDATEREMESKEGSMLSDDRSAIANLPQNVMMKPYPRCPYGVESRLDDSISGIDRQIGADDSAARRGRSKEKY